jgi:hypothetical protein
MSSPTNDKEVNTAVHDDVVAAAVDSTTVDDDHSGGGGGPVVGRETKGNNDDADALVDEKNKIIADNFSEKGRASKEIVGGGLVVGRETKGNDDDADVLVDEKNKSRADDVSEKERDSNEIDLMQNGIRKQLLKNQYRKLLGEDHGYRSPNSDQQDIVSDITDNVEKVNDEIVDKDETETDDVDEDEDEDKDEDEDVQVKPDDDSSYVPGVSLDDNDEDEDDTVGGNNDNADDVGEDEVVEGVIDAEDVGEDEVVEGFETNTKNQNHHYETWVKNDNDVVSYYNTNGDCQVTRDFATAEGRMLGNWVHDQRKKSGMEYCQMIE